ncbi:hypothetical protein CC99x_010270 [Candidatus Berkiella cookevillensis]|uniref:Histone methylation protein DOT1 n=1 Tax=Candidatus Berkiella cookevillensis TaxID=437022 RepID=A0A0Q9YH66_9GAMM|nr:hypothetical protein [Candidatus Berkiella cookevillensis]MCS5709289.1 hypothetical protein [Candidatus Berkiella cookevillensis]
MTISVLQKFKAYYIILFLKFFKFICVQETLRKAYKNIPSYSISKQYRIEYEPTNPDLIYGELSVKDFLYLCALIPKNINCKIYDLGCGDARLLLAAVLLFKDLKAVGIEKIASLQEIASTVILPMLSKIKENNSTVTVIKDNFLHYDFSDADIVYVNAAALTDATWQALHELFEKLKVGSHIITVTRKLDTQSFSLIYTGIHQASWAKAWVYIYYKFR